MLVTYEAAVKPGTSLQVVDVVERMLTETRQWEGCLDIRVSVESGSDTLFIYQRWESPELLQRFLAWRRENARPDELVDGGFLAGTPIRRTFKEL